MNLMAKKGALDEIRKRMKHGKPRMLDGMSVKVASDNPEGLKEGLDKAKEIIEGKLPEELKRELPIEPSLEEDMDEIGEMEEMNQMEPDYNSLSREELIDMIKQLKMSK